MPDSLHILLIDDDIDRAMVRRALVASGVRAEFSEAVDGQTGLAALQRMTFDCALLDQTLPDLDGLAVLQAARVAGVKTPIILLTGEGDEGLALETVRAGANDHLVKKRLSRDLLAHSVRHVVRLHRAQAEAQFARGLSAESEQRFRLMADSAPVLLWVSDEEARAVYFNQGWLTFTGRTAEQELGDGWREGIHPDDRDRLRKTRADAAAAPVKFETEFRLRRYDGEYRWLMNSASPRVLPDGTFTGYVGSCIDITERRAGEQERADLLAREQAARGGAEQAKASAEQAKALAEASERRYRFLAESIPQQVWTAWPDGRLDYVSRLSLEYFGLPPEEVLGDAWVAVIHPDDVPGCRRRWARSVRTGEEYEVEFRLRRHDGHYRWHLARALAQRDAGERIIRWFGTNTDIDDQRRHQESLRFLAEASVALASSTDYETTLCAVAKLAVPQVGDWCAIDLCEPVCDEDGGALRRVAVEHVDRAKVALAEELRRRHPPRTGDPFGIARVARTGLPELHPYISEQQIDASTADDDHATAVRTLGLRSSMAVPMLVRGNAIGVISFATTDESGRHYGDEDLALAEDLARRAAASVDNARLYEALRGSEQRFRVMAEGIPQLVWTCGSDGSCDYLSAQWVRFTGVPEGEQLGFSWVNVVHPDDAERAAAAWRDAFEGRADYDVEYRIRRHDGAYRWFQARGVPLRDVEGRVTRWFGTCTDVDDRKRFEQDLQEARDGAEAARAGAEAANAAKDRFLAVLSHELRTPLTPVLSTVQAMESEPDLPPSMRPSVEMIKRNVELEARLIDDLLDLTRVARGKLELNVQAIDAHEGMRHAIDICRDELGGKGLRLHADLLATRRHVRADSARLQQVFWNLIKNAVKFTPAGGEVWIRTANVDAGDGETWLNVEVRDSGIGIEPHILGRIFDAFEQGERSITRRFGGLGLGLSISKALIDAQGGRLSAASEGRDKGATFTLELPTVTAPAPTQPDREPFATTAVAAAAVGELGSGAPPAGAPMRILLVDDHEDTARAMGRLLQRLGHQVTIALTMAEAIAAYDRPVDVGGGADLLISDIGLPDGSGLELIRELQARRSPAGNGRTAVRGIALSGFGMEEDVRKSKEAGFFDHLTKPINFQKLEAVIRAAAAEH